VRQGEVGLEFFILFSGSVNVEVDGKVCATINTGETFGEKVSPAAADRCNVHLLLCTCSVSTWCWLSCVA
jgi:hypothetical protein